MAPLQPVADQQEGGPIARMAEAAAVEQGDLGPAQGLGLAQLRIAELAIEGGDQALRHLVVDRPQAGDGAARPGLDGDAGQPQRRSTSQPKTPMTRCRGA